MTASADGSPPSEALSRADRIHMAMVHLLRRLRRTDDEGGHTAAQLSAVTTLVASGPMTVGALAAAEHVTPATMSRLVRSLEDAGLALRRRSEEDGRAVLIRHSSRAIIALEKGRARRVEELASGLAALPSRDLEALDRAMDVLERLALSPRSGS